MKGAPQIYPDVPYFSHVQTYGRVAGPHSNNVEYVLDDEGNRWVLKRDMLGSNSILAEAIGFELSALLGIKTPRPALLDEDGQFLWMTEYLGAVKHWSPDDRHRVENLYDVGAMLTLDVIVGNNDRHAGNILLQSHGQALTAFSIDMEDSWAGTPGDIDRRDDDELPKIPPYFAPLVPLAELEPHMLDAAAICETWTFQLLEGKIRPWCNLLGETRGDAILEGLCARSARSTNLVSARVRQIRGLQ